MIDTFPSDRQSEIWVNVIMNSGLRRSASHLRDEHNPPPTDLDFYQQCMTRCEQKSTVRREGERERRREGARGGKGGKWVSLFVFAFL